MCDSHSMGCDNVLADIDHTSHLAADIGTLYLHDEYSDATLVVEGQRFPVHKVILAARSEYFRALLLGGLKESFLQQQDIELVGATPGAFRYLLQYIYTGKLNLGSMKEEVQLEILGLAHQYGFIELEAAISRYLKASVNTCNSCTIYDIASLYCLEELAEACCRFMDRNAFEILHSESLLNISMSAFKDLITRDSFAAKEIDIFKAVLAWADHNSDSDAGTLIMKAVRLPLMSLEELLNVVRQSSLVQADSILDAIKMKTESRVMSLNHRGLLIPDENLALHRHGAQVVSGEMRSSLLDGNTTNYDLDRGFTRHSIDDNQGQGIVVKLGTPSIINSIQMLLWDKDMRSYSYYIEASLDEKDWVMLVDYSKYFCRSWQTHQFQARVVSYIRIVGTHNTVNRIFHLVSFECSYRMYLPSLITEDEIIVPSQNIANAEHSACVLEGVSRSRNALINGDTQSYDWDSGYTCHQLGSGSIIVQLNQPYIIGSMRLLLWDCDSRCYSYYIEVSNNQQQWTRVVDKTKEACRSWQTITFKRQPITFVKIVGTHNTANEVFHCVHFECPSDPTALAEYSKHQANQPAQQMNSYETQTNNSRLQGMDGMGPAREDGVVDRSDGYGV